MKSQVAKENKELKNIKSAVAIHQDVDNAIMKRTAELAQLPSSIIKGLDPDKITLPDIMSKDQKFDQKTLFTFGGSKKSTKMNNLIELGIRDASKNLASAMPTSSYKCVIDARQHEYMEANLPLLKTASKLFIDDVCSGSLRHIDTSYSMFKFYINGSECKDQYLINRANNIINPTNIGLETVTARQFFAIDEDTEYIARRDGRCFIQIISHQDVAKDLYVKYVLKEAKKENILRDDKNGVVDVKIKHESVHYPKSMEVFDVLGLEAENYDFTKSLEDNGVDVSDIETELLNTEVKYSINGAPISKYDAYELTCNESFEEFARRYLTGKTSAIYELPNSLDKNINYMFSMNNNAITEEVGQEVLHSIFGANGFKLNSEVTMSATESVNTMTTRRFTDKDKDILKNTSFEEIYSIQTKTILERAGFDVGNEAVADINEIVYTDDVYGIDTLYQKVLRSEFVEDSTMSFEDFNNIKSFRDFGEIAFEDPTVDGNLFNPNTVADGTAKPKDSASKDQDDITELRQKHKSKLDKMFNGIRGETVKILDNTRTIPIIVNDRLIGCYHMDYTSADVNHLISVRSVMGNPLAYQTNMDLLALDKEQQEETMGRLLFSDTIKPILMKNMNTAFLRDNVELLYTLQKLLEENSVSLTTSVADITRYSMFNLARLSFIPAANLIFKRNGETGLGYSTFEEALVPANMYILARESYLSWICADGKGASILVIPKGLSEQTNETGTSSLLDQVAQMQQTRNDIRDMGGINFPLSRKLLTMVKDNDAPSPEVMDIQYPEFDISDDKMNIWLQEATNIVGYSSALFLTNDGNVELARKLFEINDSKILDVKAAQRFKARSSSQLATQLLKVRGGELYDNWTVEWIAPSVDRGNTQKMSEISKEMKDATGDYVAIMDLMYKGDPYYKKYKHMIIRDVVEVVSNNNSIISQFQSIYETAVAKASNLESSQIEETAEVTNDEPDAVNETDEYGEMGDMDDMDAEDNADDNGFNFGL